MLQDVFSTIKTAFWLFITLTLLTGVIYPLVVTFCAQLFFSTQANGSLIVKDNKVIGSELIGQNFKSERNFWGRPSATLFFPYNTGDSNSSNANVSAPEFKHILKERIDLLALSDPLKRTNPPMDLITASASGLDPDISPEAAFFQAPRVALARGIPVEEINRLIEASIKPRTFKLLGERRVNVLELNLKLEDFQK